MKIYYNLDHVSISNSAITVGTFDGLHLGHQYLIKELVRRAKIKGLESVVFTFDPYPQEVFAPKGLKASILSTTPEKIDILRSLGVDHVVVYPFSLSFAQLSASSFIQSILVEKLSLRYLLLGYDHRFGKDQVDDMSTLEVYGRQFGFELDRLDQKRVSTYDLSSSLIRQKIMDGDLTHMTDLLGRYYSITGVVVEGKQIGRQIHFPTANVRINDVRKLIPKIGVYAIRVLWSGDIYHGMLNIGIRPTLEEKDPKATIEAHIFDFHEDIYQENITIEFVSRVRDEKKFDSLENLMEQLKQDEGVCRLILSGKE
ncbi:bifunctional riboflavin kinase/FAD synthetase [Halosquirtibacter xylanolyticus]|uniref:bifunctional riboflavin kinase/FAD synthetase n=1 Tax=Halosquirtibacter xylanolyticus TaxID=3374599 RepID=UPI00374A07C8|nr:bifunctional riboflavin kinase/FAD synthetase [Prolixibacteraceae bacterium]